MKTTISTPNAPAAIGPYSQAVKANEFLFLSGQIPLNPATGQIDEVDAVEQTKRVMANIKAVLESEGLTFDNVVKTTIFLTNLEDFARVNEVYGACFKNDPTARSSVQVSTLPRGGKVEIEPIAVLA